MKKNVTRKSARRSNGKGNTRAPGKQAGTTPARAKLETPAWMQLIASLALLAWAVLPTLARVAVVAVLLGLLVKVYREKPKRLAITRASTVRFAARLANWYQAFLEHRLSEARTLRAGLRQHCA
jgi:hypothetical protein